MSTTVDFVAVKPAVTESMRVQTLRGTACLLLVAFHVIGATSTQGLNLPVDSPYVTFTKLFMHLRMPLFAFLSGFVYAYRPMTDAREFLSKKLSRLLVPLVVVATIFFITQLSIGGTNFKMTFADMWTIYLFPYCHFWFLQAIIVIFAMTAAIEHFKLMRTPRAFMLVFAGILAAHFLLPTPDFLSISRAFFLAPFFFAGIGVNRFRGQMQHMGVRWAVMAVFLLSFSAYAAVCFIDPALLPEQKTVWATLIGLSGCLTLMYLMPSVRWLGWVGSFSFTIYLYHVFFTAGTRIALYRLGDFNVHDHVIMGLVLGIAGPVLFELAVRRYRVGRRVLLGQS